MSAALLSIEGAIRDLLVANPTINSLVGDRVYPQDAPQSATVPYVLYETSDPFYEENLQGLEGQEERAFRFSCYGGGGGGSYRSAKSIARAVRETLFGFLRGTLVDGQITVHGIFQDSGGEDGQEIPISGEEDPIDYVAVQVRVIWQLTSTIAR